MELRVNNDLAVLMTEAGKLAMTDLEEITIVPEVDEDGRAYLIVWSRTTDGKVQNLLEGDSFSIIWSKSAPVPSSANADGKDTE